MDSLSQIALGGAVAAACVPAPHRRAALLAGAPRVSVPMSFNTLLWRVVAMTPDGYVVGDRSVLVDRAPMRFTHHASDTAALAEVAGAPAVRRLNGFNHGFMRAQARADALVLSDLRMGLEPAYTFNFAVAARADGRWRPIAPQAVPAGEGGILSPGGLGPAWRAVWRRIWHEPG